ncbi:hypothetical protein BAUCODRAFT_327199 [Baudoinia panamericana UAMH 10762]|uniref:Uncharacterized protein n=1 Tax=Baudoinia panamericana (strain UAMH 10762) TaxID=717646 RepID=M2LBY0_BAUPA|nr:uncharacterized protein BAUCODRAFT_327199 [Baudoinia panamericana UAMH 10762]EMC91407.1 hypothetical protein BAUCODRAFT_327199 [Baudoinia panamericana UAMH 10762]
MPRFTSPSSELGRLDLRDRDRTMPPETRSQRAERIRQEQDSRNTRASQRVSRQAAGAGPSRTTTGSHQSPTVRSPWQQARMLGSATTQAARMASSSAVADDGEPRGDESDGDDGSSSEGDDGGDGGDAENAAVVHRARQYVGLLMTVFDPCARLTPEEFAQVNAQSSASRFALLLIRSRTIADNCNSQATRRLAAAIVQLIGPNGDRLAQFQNTVNIPVGRGWWAGRLADHMRNRLHDIFAALARHVQDQTQGVGVITTIDKVRDLFGRIDGILRRQLNSMAVEDREPYVGILVDALWHITARPDDIYPRDSGPIFVGEAIRSERNLLSCFLSPYSQPISCINILSHISVQLLEPHRATIVRSCRQMRQTLASDRSLDQRVQQAIHTLERRKLFSCLLCASDEAHRPQVPTDTPISDKVA